METLHARIEKIKSASAKKIPEHYQQTMHEATEQLGNSGLVEKALGAGDSIPGFELNDSRGNAMAVQDPIRNGPLVISFFRGHW